MVDAVDLDFLFDDFLDQIFIFLDPVLFFLQLLAQEFDPVFHRVQFLVDALEVLLFDRG